MSSQFIVPKQQQTIQDIVQLCYVLPRNSLLLLPDKLYTVLMRKYEHWYKVNCDFIWAYCRYFWESHVQLVEIDIDELEAFIEAYKHLLQ